MKRVPVLVLLFALTLARLTSAQAVVVPSPVPSCANGDVLTWNTATSLFICTSIGAASQPFDDSLGILANNADPTKILRLSVSAIAPATTRVWTVPDANVTIPSTIASLAANTFTSLQTMNGGFASTTGTLSSTLSVAGVTTLNTVAYTWPGSQGAADTFLKNNGSGTLSWGTQSAALPSPVTQNLIFTDNTYDIGASGATRPRNYFGAGNMTIGGTLGVTGASTLTSLSATSGAFSTTLSVTGASTLAAVAATTGTFSSIVTITGNLTLSGTGNAVGTITSGIWNAGAVTSSGTVTGVAGTFSGALTTSLTTDATTTTTGALRSAGGLGVTKAIWAGGDITTTASNPNIVINRATGGTAGTLLFKVNSVAEGQLASSAGDMYWDYPGSMIMRGGYGGTTRVTLTTGGAWRWHAYGAGTLTTDSSGNITAVSDERMKNIVGPFTPGLREMMGIKPILYRYNKASGLDQENVYAGFSAQNVLGYVPEAVGKNLEGFYSLNIVPLLAASVTAIQELSREVDELRAVLKLPAKQRSSVKVTDEKRVVSSATKARLDEIAKQKERK